METSLIEKEWTANGLKCVVARMVWGGDPKHRCGYVGVTGKHPLFEADYSQAVKKPIPSGPIGKRGIIPVFFMAGKTDEGVPLDVYFDVHGGLTYSRLTKPGDTYPCHVEEPTWFFGFDCAHSGDDFDGGQSLEYVAAECESLAKQLAEYSEEET